MSEAAGQLRSRAATALSRPLSEPELGALRNYLNLLIKWQKTQRLVGSSSPKWIVDNVIVDSLLFTRALPPGIAALCDVGSGAGVPGIPLKIVLPDVAVTLVESRARRASFLAAAIREIPLTGCRLVNRRLEDVAAEMAGTFDAVVMRCAGDPTELVDDVGVLLRPGGVIVASGPPRPAPLSIGEWLEVGGPMGPRRFWIHRVT